MGLESKNKKRHLSGSCTAWKAELSQTCRIKVVVKKRIEVEVSLQRGYCNRVAFKGVLVGNDMEVCVLEIKSCHVLCYCTSTAKGCPVYPFKYLPNHIGTE